MEKEPDKLRKLEESLYSKDWRPPENGRATSGLSEGTFATGSVKDSWGEVPAEDKAPTQREVRKKIRIGLLSNMSFLRQLLIVSILFFVLSGGVAFYVFFMGGNVISSSNIDIKVNAQLSIAGGEKTPIQISVQNQNNVPLVYADLVVEYPEGARYADDLGREIKRYRESLGNMDVGEKVTKQLEAVIFGEEGSRKIVRVSLEYRVSGSNAIFSKETSHEFVISSSPVSVRVEGPEETGSGSPVAFKIRVISNSDSVIKNFAVKAEYPFGFRPTDSSPRPSIGNNFWNLGDLRPGSERVITLNGVMDGEEGEEKAIRLSAGIARVDDERQISVSFVEKSVGIFIRRPLVDARILFDGEDAKEYVTKAGNRINVQISWANNMPTSAENLVIEAVLKGELFDRYSIQVQEGFFRSADGIIVWDQTNNPAFGTVDAGERGSVGFSFNILDRVSYTNPEMSVEVRIKTGASSGAEISSSISKKIKISSIFSMNAKTLYASGPLQNTGPVPPQAERETTYTVTLSLGSSINDMSGVSVRMFLPNYVRWLEKTSPSTEKFTYNMLSGELIWLAGEVKGGTGFSQSPREVSFQVALLPSITQIGTEPVLVRDIEAQAEDRFTGAQERASVRSLTTNLSADPSAPAVGGAVRK